MNLSVMSDVEFLGYSIKTVKQYSFDKVAYLAKKALLRPLDVPNPDPYYADLEKELLTAINELGIGPQGFGGRTTCLGLAIEQMPTHVAGLPVAVNVSCHVTRRASATL